MTLHLPESPRLSGPIPDPGTYHDMPNDDYHALRAVSSGFLKLVGHRAPIHARHWLESEPGLPSAAMRLGTALHAALLEPEVYAAAPTIEGLKPGAKPETFAKHANEHGPVILAEGWSTAIAEMCENLQDLEHCPDFDRGSSELVIVWDEETLSGYEIRCKARVDHYQAEILYDLKTARSANPDEFGKQSWNLGYHLSLAHYKAGLESAGNDVSDIMLLVTETEPPYDSGAYKVSDDLLERGVQSRAEALDKLAWCLELDEWPGSCWKHDGSPVELAAPAWARK